MDNQKYINLLGRLISCPSFSGQEELVADILSEFIRSRSLHFERIGNNIILRNAKFDESTPSVVLNSHLDTVKPNASWTVDPFEANIANGKLTGLGSNDAGGALVALLAAYEYFAKKDLNRNLVFIASTEEENSGTGGIRSVLPELDLNIDLAIVGEPTEMKAAIAEKGLLVIDACASGRSGHAARPNGMNAIDIAMHDIVAINDFKYSRVSENLGPVVASVTLINAGTQHNVIPDVCDFVIDARVNELYTLHEVFEELDSLCRSTLTARSFKNHASSIDSNHPFMSTIHECGIDVFGSPTLSDQAHFNCPSVKIGPGLSERSHQADEFIYLSEIEDGINTYVRLLKKYLL